MDRRDCLKWLPALGLCAGSQAFGQQDGRLLARFGDKNAAAARSILGRSQEEILRESARLAPMVSDVLMAAKPLLDGQATGLEVQDFIVKQVTARGLLPAMVGFQAYPAAIALSSGAQLLHALPTDEKVKPASLVKLELGVSSDLAFASQGWTFATPGASDEDLRLLATARKALDAGLREIKAGVALENIGAAIQEVIERDGFRSIRPFCGYSMGQVRMKEPLVCSFGRRGQGAALEAGQILHVMALAKAGSEAIKIGKDGWSAVASDGRAGAMASAMAAVEAGGCRLLGKYIS